MCKQIICVLENAPIDCIDYIVFKLFTLINLKSFDKMYPKIFLKLI